MAARTEETQNSRQRTPAMATSNVSELYLACRNGDLHTVERLLPHTPLRELNRLEPNGSTCLHAACYYGHTEIVRALLDHGACRTLLNTYKCTPLDEAKKPEIIALFPRQTQAAQQRFAPDVTEQRLEWSFADDQAESYSRATHYGSVKDRGVKETVKKIFKSDALSSDETSKGLELVKQYLTEAQEKNDPILLLKAYTVESNFYRKLNKTMASGKEREVFEKLLHKWTGYYTGALVRNRALDPYRFSGQTYRGMPITPADFALYKPGVALTNKSFQSTSKSWKIAKGFANQSQTKPGTLPVILIFTITDPRSALCVEELSEYPNEHEVLVVPGTFFLVANVNLNETPHEIELQQIPWTD